MKSTPSAPPDTDATLREIGRLLLSAGASIVPVALRGERDSHGGQAVDRGRTLHEALELVTVAGRLAQRELAQREASGWRLPPSPDRSAC